MVTVYKLTFFKQLLFYINITTSSLSFLHAQCCNQKEFQKRSTIQRRRLYFVSLSLLISQWSFSYVVIFYQYTVLYTQCTVEPRTVSITL